MQALSRSSRSSGRIWLLRGGRQSWEQAEGWNLGFIDADPRLRAQVYNPSAVQTIFRPYQSQQAAVPGSQAQVTPQPQQSVKGVWAFGGSRVTPPEVQEVIARLAVRHGGPVVHGGAPGADRAATRLITDPSLISIYLNGPNDLRGPIHCESAAEFSTPGRCLAGVKP